MASSRTGTAGSSSLFSRSDKAALIEQLSDDLITENAILQSLQDIPESVSVREEKAAVKLKIIDIRRKIAEARGKPKPVAGRTVKMEGNQQEFDWYMPSNISTPISSSSGDGLSQPSNNAGSRKRSFGTSQLGTDPFALSANKSRRASPNPGFGTSVLDDEVIDLTGDDELWRDQLLRQKTEMDRFARNKADVDRDAAFARQMTGLPPASFSNHLASGPARSNAFHRILNNEIPSSRRANQVPNSMSQNNTQQGFGSTLAARSQVSVHTGQNSSTPPGSFHAPSTKQEPERNRYKIPGAFQDSDSELEDAFSPTDFLFPHAAQPSQPSFPLQPLPRINPPTFSDPQSSSNSFFGTNNTALQLPGFPTMDIARQNSLSRQGSPFSTASLSSLAPFMDMPGSFNQYSSTLYNRDRPGLLNNGAYFAPTANSSLSATINRVNNYDFNSLMDADGNALSSRLVDFLDDYVHDPRKTEEEIQQLLSNIRPDMEIPEEERGQTPEAMRYPLYTHQQLALKWMTGMEDNLKGGILADDMGLGKTISTLALMVSRPSTNPSIKTNLIIGPVALIKQWESEVKKKLKASHKMSVYLLHQKRKMSFADIRKYDVVLTTYGSIAAEWKRYSKHVEERIESPQYRPDADLELAKKCPILHPKSVFYRIILDEAQCIKNKETQGSKGVSAILATYRWCLTGTPMMNSVSELFPLIRFLRIKPYCEVKEFQRAFKNLSARNGATDFSRNQAMTQLRVTLKAIMLRRMKNSEIDGKPIISLPPKTENSEMVVFSDDEKQFYNDLETRSQVIFNKYLRTGTVGKNYSNILVLLLRLRQACCHPHLIDFECVGSSEADDGMIDRAKGMNAAVVERIKTIEAWECPICYDAVEDPVLMLPCGHDTCSECFTSLTDKHAREALASGNETGNVKCPQCRGLVKSGDTIKYKTFQRVHMPETIKEEEKVEEELPEISDWTDSSDDEDEGESDNESVGSLTDFVVPDDLDELDEEERVEAELAAEARAKKVKQAKEARKAKDEARQVARKMKSEEKRSKAKAKLEPVNPGQLRTLRQEAGSNKEARRRYMHYLKNNWEDSAKVTKVLDLLKEIQETGEKTIIFSQWTSLLDLIECQIKEKLGIRYSRYTGDMSCNRRNESVVEFVENPANKVMLVSLKAGNAGLNLTVASRIIICDPFWNPFIEMQAIDRAHRIGQQREVQVHRIIIEGTVEDRILQLQESKRRLVEAALDEGESKNLGRLSERELASLFGVTARY
ncbi:ATP-dependent helicase ULS1 [Cladorrhinum sp. PSN259]|nr:ATP-dependent helicase ULS1 [Cladorrhinum sp. PSN259]